MRHSLVSPLTFSPLASSAGWSGGGGRSLRRRGHVATSGTRHNHWGGHIKKKKAKAKHDGTCSPPSHLSITHLSALRSRRLELSHDLLDKRCDAFVTTAAQRNTRRQARTHLDALSCNDFYQVCFPPTVCAASLRPATQAHSQPHTRASLPPFITLRGGRPVLV